jgi:hypothetical protein
MGKDSKDHPLGERGSTGGPGLAESGARNWVHSAATVLDFLRKERGLLRPGNSFQPIIHDDLLREFEARKRRAVQAARKVLPDPKAGVIIDRSDPKDTEIPPTEPAVPG